MSDLSFLRSAPISPYKNVPIAMPAAPALPAAPVLPAAPALRCLVSFIMAHFTRFWPFLIAIIYGGILLGPIHLGGRELPAPYSALDQVKNLRALLAEGQGRYELLAGDLFEEEGRYRSYAASRMLASLRSIFISPPGQAFHQERLLVRDFIDKGALFQKSLFIHTAFNLPGRESFQFKLRQPLPLKGKPYLASLWIHSQLYPHRIKLLFQDRGREISSPATEPLLWDGWRRLEIPLVKLQNRNRRADRSSDIRFSGFVLQSSSRAEAGQLSLMIDNLLILSDMQELRYPGFEIEDNWR